MSSPWKKEPGKAEVRFYSGYKGEEQPSSVVLGGREYFIEKILKRERILDSETGEIRERFDCKTAKDIIRISRSPSGEWEVYLAEESTLKK